MIPQPRELRLYVTQDGKAPFSQWLRDLGKRDRKSEAVIRIRLERVRLGNMGDCKSLGGGVFELRVDQGPGSRVYFGQFGHQIVLLLCGGDKRSQAKDIQRAKRYWKNYTEAEP